jgi:hypothetical protein
MWPCYGMSWPALYYSMTATCCKHLLMCSAFRTWCWNYSECTLYYFWRSENLEITLKITHSIFLCVSDSVCSETFHCVWVMSIHGCINQFNPFGWFLFMAGCCASTISATADLFLCQVKCMCITLSTCYSSSVPVECDLLSDPALHYYSTTTACMTESRNILAQFSEGYMWTK